MSHYYQPGRVKIQISRIRLRTALNGHSCVGVYLSKDQQKDLPGPIMIGTAVDFADEFSRHRYEFGMVYDTIEKEDGGLLMKVWIPPQPKLETNDDQTASADHANQIRLVPAEDIPEW